MVNLRIVEEHSRDELIGQSKTQPRHRRLSISMIKPAAVDSVPTEPGRRHRRRSSAFLEVGLGGDDAILDAKIRRSSRPKLQVRFSNEVEVVEPDAIDWPDETELHRPPWERSQMHPTLPIFFPTLPRILFLAFVLALLIPSLNNSRQLTAGIRPIGAKAGPLKTERREITEELVTRQDSTTDVCVRWSQQTALVNGTLYSYGGHASMQPGQTENTWSKAGK
jgi:hypothetical protein